MPALNFVTQFITQDTSSGCPVASITSEVIASGRLSHHLQAQGERFAPGEQVDGPALRPIIAQRRAQAERQPVPVSKARRAL
jgi:hypothetical protein